MKIKGLTDQEVIEKHRNGKVICQVLQGGGEVVGQEIDESDHLVYVLRKGEEIVLHHAFEIEVSDLITQGYSQRVIKTHHSMEEKNTK